MLAIRGTASHPTYRSSSSSPCPVISCISHTIFLGDLSSALHAAAYDDCTISDLVMELDATVQFPLIVLSCYDDSEDCIACALALMLIFCTQSTSSVFAYF